MRHFHREIDLSRLRLEGSGAGQDLGTRNDGRIAVPAGPSRRSCDVGLSPSGGLAAHVVVTALQDSRLVDCRMRADERCRPSLLRSDADVSWAQA